MGICWPTSRHGWHGSSALLHEAVEALPAESPLRARLLSRLAVALPFGDHRKREFNEAAEAIARRANDEGALGQVLSDRFFVVQGPDVEPAYTVELADEAIRLAQASNDVDLQTVGRAWRLGGLFDLGDMVVVDREIAAIEAFAEQIRRPNFWWWTFQWKASRAIIAGEYEACEEFARRASIVGQGVQNIDPTMAIQRTFMQLRDQGRLREIEPMVTAGRELSPDHPLSDCALAFISAELGDETLARSGFERVAAGRFGEMPRDGAWFTMMALLSATCAYLGDGDRAGILYDMLRPYAPRYAITSGAGSISSSLGLLATTMRRYDDAARHFEEALAMNTHIGARPEVARTQLEYARMLRKRNAAGDAERARELLDAALATARKIGMAKVTADCEALLAEM
jgi:tetratricopeptide (TPR) repeat protein